MGPIRSSGFSLPAIVSRLFKPRPVHPGEWIVEQPSDIHEAANHGSARIVIYLATLLETGAPPATPVTLPPGK